MTRVAPALLLSLLLRVAAPADGTAELAAERVVFHTAAGDLVFALYPNSAPETVRQFLRLVRAGVYDTTSFARIHPGFIAQVSSAQDRLVPLAVEQSALLRKLPLEASDRKHLRGALSLAHPDGDPDGGESSFCVMLGAAPQLDGKYTVFGTLMRGDAVLEEMLQVPRSSQMAPSVRLTIARAEVYESAQALGKAYLSPAHPVAGLAARNFRDGDSGHRLDFLACGILLMVLLVAAIALLGRRLSQRVASALHRVVLLVGVFLLLTLLLPEGQHRSLLAVSLFFGLLGVIRALGSFEVSTK